MELPELGEQCSFVGCGQLDFLPFNCDGCDRTFCLEHRTSHGCRAGGKRVRSLPSRYRSETTIPVTTTVTPAVAFLAGASFTSGLRPHFLSSSRPSLDPQDTTCVVCPLCGGGVKHVPGESIHVTYERHASGGSCDPSRHPLARSARRCPARGCREKLNAVNAYTCRSCGSEVCLKHRHERLHDCEANRRARMMRRGAAGAGRSASGRMSSGSGRGGGGVVGARGIGVRGGGGASASGRPSSRGGSGARVAGGRPASATLEQKNKREVCETCGKSFPHLAALIAHAERTHGTHGAYTRAMNAGAHGESLGGAREVCPICGKSFEDLGELIAHVESKHEKKSKSGKCVVM